MATPQVIIAIIRAARPTFRSKNDRLAYAVHAFLLANGYKLVATGKKADVPSNEIPDDAPEVGIEGWTDFPDSYAFRYVDTTGKRTPVNLKLVPMGDTMLLQWASPGSFDEPRMMELNVDDYITDDAKPDDVAAAYKNLGDLASRLQSFFYVGAAKDAAAPPKPTTSTETRAGSDIVSEARAPAPATLEDDPPGPPPQPPQVPYVPRVGTDDLNPPVMPPGGLPPGLGPDLGEGPGPLPGGVPGRRGGGMHVGPGDPLFRSPPRPGLFPGGDPGRFPGDIPGGPDFDPAEPGMPGMAVPPGARWDPINPPGLEGFRPGDFQRRGRGAFGPRPDIHPDIMPPGPGRGSTFDGFI